MSALVGVLAALFGAAVVVLLLALALPLRLRLRATTGPPQRLILSGVPFGGAGPHIRMVDTGRRRKPKPSKRKPRRDGKGWRGGPPGAVMRHLPGLIVALLRRFSVVELRARGAAGLDDPADTGVLFGLLCPLRFGFPPGGPVSVELEPVFDREHLEGEVSAAVEVIPATLLPPLLRFGWQAFVADRRP